MVLPESFAAKVRAQRGLPAPAMRRAIRVDAGLTQADVAAILGVERETVTRWESGVRAPRRDLLCRYHDLLVELRDER